MSTRVEISSGRLRGRREEGVDVFLGVPYAAPPTGSRRFRPPQPATPWAGEREATAFGASAPQNALEVGALPGMDVGPSDEDCLSLNVYTPAADAGRRPVLVWIHGGAFTIGSSSQTMYDGRPLARRGDVVVVTINYRLGALGFLDLETRFGDELADSANLGIADQIAALRWVRENIDRFGGDPDNVTIFGESAGGMSVGTLFGSPAARDLFRRAIPQSGAAHNAHAPEAAAGVLDRFLRELGASDVAALRAAPVEAILAAQLRCVLAAAELDVMLCFQPSVGGALLPESPLAAVAAGLSADRPLLIGTTRDEWRLFQSMDPGLAKLDDAGFEARVLARVGAEAAPALVETYRKQASDAGAVDHFVAFETDRVFRVPALRLADAQAAQGVPVHVYEFAWPSPAMGGSLGACHALELPFVFGTLDAPGMPGFAGRGPEAEALRDRMMDSWLGFARGGEPGHGGLPEWPRHHASERPALVYDREPRVECASREQSYRAWDGVL